MSDCWIKFISPHWATGRVKEVYEPVATTHDNIDNVYQAQSLRPETILGHDLLYKSVLHFENPACPPWFLEAVAVFTSVLNLKKARLILVVAAVLFFHAAAVSTSVFASESQINCDAHHGVCLQSLGNLTVSLEISPQPVQAMQDLVFKVSISGNPPSKPPYIDLGMPGMKMGPNRVMLKRTGQGFYEGKGVIVRCPSGRKTWFANVTIPGSGEVKFIFDVIY